MSKNYWFISDTHFQHNNIIKFNNEEFNSVQQRDELLIQNWNNSVKPGDHVYHLGDVFFGSKESFLRMWPRLNGRKRLIVGNHDDVKFLSSGALFEKVMLWRHWKLSKTKSLLFTHVPLHPENIRGDLNVHGHTHLKGSPKGPYRSVCVELNNYTPVNLDEL